MSCVEQTVSTDNIHMLWNCFASLLVVKVFSIHFTSLWVNGTITTACCSFVRASHVLSIVNKNLEIWNFIRDLSKTNSRFAGEYFGFMRRSKCKEQRIWSWVMKTLKAENVNEIKLLQLHGNNCKFSSHSWWAVIINVWHLSVYLFIKKLIPRILVPAFQSLKDTGCPSQRK